MPNNCVTCGRIRDRRINSTNWERHINACAMKNINNKRKKNSTKYYSHSIHDFFNKKIKIQANNGKYYNTSSSIHIYLIYVNTCMMHV